MRPHREPPPTPTDPTSPPWAAFVLLGPGDATITRTIDLLESLAHHERGALSRCDLVLVNDRNRDIDRLSLVLDGFRSVTEVRNPAPASVRLWDRHSAGTLAALHEILAKDRHAFALKFDEDALVIDAFTPRLQALFDGDPSLGMVGSFRSFPGGEENQGLRTLRHLVDNAERRFPRFSWVREWHRERPLRGLVRLVSKYPRRIAVLERANRNGYRAAEHVVGGAYALSASVLDEFRDARWFPEPADFEGSRFGEDLLVSVCTVAAGKRLASYNAQGEVFGVWWQAPSMTPQELVAKGFAIVHSVKDHPGFDEIAFRSWFRHRRDPR